MPKIRKIDLTNPVVFDAVFTKPFFAADFLNATGKFKVKEENIIIEKTKFSEGVNVKYVDMDVVLRILNEKNLFDNKTEFISFEQQKRKPQYDMTGRLVTYLEKLINKSEPVGPGYQNNKCTVIAILSFNLFDDEKFLRTFKLKDEDGNVIEYASIIVIELTKKKFCNTIDLKKWIEIFTNLNLEENIEYLKNSEGINIKGNIEIEGEYLHGSQIKYFKDTLDIDLLAPYDEIIDKEIVNLKINDFDYINGVNKIIFTFNSIFSFSIK